jgi:predicted nucleic acid-binding protein
MPDIVLDSDALADFLAQYFGPAERGREAFVAGDWLSSQAAQEINRIRDHSLRGSLRHLVIASSLAFVEVVRKWDSLSKARITPWQLKAFLQQPPEWFSIAPVDEDLVEPFLDVPAEVAMPGEQQRPVEWTDAVHVATVFSRGDSALFHTRDRRLRRIERLAGRVV